MKSEILTLCDKLNCTYSLGEKLSEYTTMKLGGPCSLMVNVYDADSLAELLHALEEYDIKHVVLGRGSNILVPDDGYDGVVIRLNYDFLQVYTSDICEITAGAGAPLKQVCTLALNEALTGMEFAYGIPGTVGGALYMNAGAFGGEMKDVVVSARCLGPDGIVELSNEEMALGYRQSIFMDGGYTILSARFSLSQGITSDIREKMDGYLLARRTKQPLEFASAGSTFKRPDGDYAARLIEQCGLKGRRIGGAQVSEKHSGFIINTGNATYSDVMQLISLVKQDVYAKTGILLELEPIILN